MPLSPRVRVLIVAVIALGALAVLIWALSARSRSTPVTPIAIPPAGTPRDAPTVQNSATPFATSSASPTVEGTQESRDNRSAIPPTPAGSPSVDAAGSTKLIIPVAGVRPEQLHDTYNEARSEGRVHNAIDIIAPRGTPVLAAADGLIIKLFQSERGGLTAYQLSTDNKMVYYYAHLDHYADGLTEKHFAHQGEEIGYVGDTGNAGPGNYHLHFAIWTITDPQHFWDGNNINPYPLLVK